MLVCLPEKKRVAFLVVTVELTRDKGVKVTKEVGAIAFGIGVDAMHVIAFDDDCVQVEIVLVHVMGKRVHEDLPHVVIFDEQQLALVHALGHHRSGVLVCGPWTSDGKGKSINRAERKRLNLLARQCSSGPSRPLAGRTNNSRSGSEAGVNVA